MNGGKFEKKCFEFSTWNHRFIDAMLFPNTTRAVFINFPNDFKLLLDIERLSQFKHFRCF
jgi:hypothetical protein